MGIGVNVNCKHYSRGDCSKKPKFLRLIKRTCSELFYGMSDVRSRDKEKCELKEEWPRPKHFPPPPPSVGGLVLTEEEKEVIRTMRKEW